MEQLILIVHVLVALAITGLILLQQGKGADMGASFGAGASQTLFGSSGSGNALTRGTAILATLFFATSFGLAIVAKNSAMSAGDIDLPDPALIETQAADVADPEVPELSADAVEAVQGGDLDIPEQAAGVEGDLPAGSGADAGAAGDIPQ